MSKKVKNSRRSLKVASNQIGMISLVDILANSLIVMILLIFITLKVNEEVAEKEKQSLKEVSVLMSRKIASKVVSNSLATSRPAFLHDYHSSPLDINPDERIMPVLELHKNFVRLFYTGKTVSFSNLLKKDNALDHYLSRLTDQQKLRVRLDLYDVPLYYILMSILKDHGITIRHWHLLGYKESPPKADEYIPESQAQKQRKSEKKETDETVDTYGDSFAEHFPEFASPENNQPGSEEFMKELNKRQEELDGEFSEMLEDLIPELGEDEIDALKKFFENMPPLPPMSDNPEMRFDPEMFKQFLKDLAKSLLNQKPPDFQLRIPDSNSPLMPPPSDSNPPTKPDPEAFLTAMLQYLQEKQFHFDEGIMSDIDQSELMFMVLRFASNKEAMKNSSLYPMALRILNEFAYLNDKSDISSDSSADAEITPGSLLLNQLVDTSTNRPNHLRLLKNKSLNDNTLLSDKRQTKMDIYQNPSFKEIDLAVRRFPTNFKGEKVRIDQNNFVVVPPSLKRSSGYDWRLIAVINNRLSDIVIGYVYASFDNAGNLLLPLPENNVWVNGKNIASLYEASFFKSEILLLLVFVLLSAFMVIFYLRVNRS